MLPDDYKVELVKISELKPAEYNPRQASQKQIKHIRDSIRKFKMVEPIVVNGSPERKNVIIGGHIRTKIWQELGHDAIPVHYIDLSLNDERELNLRLNKNQAEFDFELLANYEEQELISAGFEATDLERIFKEPMPNQVKGEIEFSPELLESQNYVVLYFDNELDWQVAQTKLGIKPAKDIKGLNTGVGRVLKGMDIVNKLP